MTDTPNITLDGKTYPIPRLAIRQNRFVEPLAAKHAKFFQDVIASGGVLNPLDVTPEQAEDFAKIVYHAVTRAQPTLTYDEFENMPVSMRDLMIALPTCIKQSGLFRPVEPGSPPTGEATSPSTGTPPSPSSATP